MSLLLSNAAFADVPAILLPVSEMARPEWAYSVNPMNLSGSSGQKGMQMLDS